MQCLQILYRLLCGWCVQRYVLDLALLAIGLAASRIGPISEMTRHRPEPDVLVRSSYRLFIVSVIIWLGFDAAILAFLSRQGPLGQGNGTADHVSYTSPWTCCMTHFASCHQDRYLAGICPSRQIFTYSLPCIYESGTPPPSN